MVTLAAIQTQYKYALQDKGGTLEDVAASADDVRNKAIEEAIRWYSRRVPQIKTSLISANTTGFYAVPSDWKPNSRIVSIEFPLDQNPPAYTTPQRKAIRYQRRETGLFYHVDPNPSGSYRLTYTTKHSETTPTTIPDEHDAILGKMAAALASLEFAARYANSVSNNLDAVNYRTKEQEWRAVHKALLEQIEAELRRDEWANVYASDGDALSSGWRL